MAWSKAKKPASSAGLWSAARRKGTFVTSYAATLRGFRRDARLLLASWTLGAIGAGAVATLYNLYLLALGYREDFLGLLLFTGAMAGGLAALPAGWLSDRAGARPAMLGGMVVLGAAMLVEYLATMAWLLLAGAAVAAAAAAVVSVAQTPLLYSSAGPHERTHLFGAGDALFIVFSAAGSLLAGLLVVPVRALWPQLDLAGAYRLVLLAVSAIAALAIVPLCFVRPDGTPFRDSFMRERHSSPAGTRPGPRDHLARLRAPAATVIWKLSLANAVMGLGAGLSIPFLNVFLVERLGADAAAVSVVRAGSTLGSAVGALAGPLAAGALGTVTAATLVRLASVPFLWLLGLTGTLGLAGAAFMVRASLVNAAGPIIAAFSMDVVDAAWRARANASLMVSWGLSYALGSLAGGALLAGWPRLALAPWPLRHGGYSVAFALTGALYVAAALLFWAMFREGRMEKAGAEARRG